MDKTFASLKGLLKVNSVVIDTAVSRLHYKFTAFILGTLGFLVSSKEIFGDPIVCMAAGKKEEKFNKVLDAFCWVQSTFSIEDAWYEEVGSKVPYPGVDTYTPGKSKVFHRYYQWVCLVLFLQAVLFYMPRYLWKVWENQRMKALTLELNSPVLGREKREVNIDLLSDYLVHNLGHHTWYGILFVFCEILNLINVVGQQLLLDVFFHGEFSRYGLQVLKFANGNWSEGHDPMIQIFPRLAKCTFHNFGSSGSVEKLDALCVLPINVINEKIFIFLWFWFLILSCLTAIMVIIHLILIFSCTVRCFVLRCKLNFTNYDYLRSVLKRCSYADWLILDLLCKNLDSINFKDLVTNFALKLTKNRIEVKVNGRKEPSLIDTS